MPNIGNVTQQVVVTTPPGESLQSAFVKINNDFSNVWAAGPVGSNVRIANNSINTLNTNGGLVLNPNGIGSIIGNAHVVPDQTRIRNLGSSTRFWNTLYTWYGNIQNATIANATIGNTTISNIGNISIGVANLHISGGTNGYVLQTDGTGNLTWTAQTGGNANTGNVTFDNINIIGTGNLHLQPDPANNLAYLDVYLTTGSDIHIAGNSENVIIGRDSGANVLVGASGNVTIQADSGTPRTWDFDNAGLLTLPGGGTITSALGVPQEGLWLGYNGHRLLLNSDGQFWTGGIELGGNALPGYVGSYGNITLNANIGTGPLEKQWVFGTDGNLTLPGGGYIGAAGIKGDGTMLTGGLGQIASLTSFYADAPGIYAGCFTANPDGNVNISTYGNGTGLIGSWAFDNTGNLTVPGNIIMTTGIVGSGASPAPYLSGFDSVSAVTLSASGNVTGAYVKGNGSELTNLPAPVVTQDITSNGAMSIMTYDGNIKYVNYATVEPSTGNIAGGNISAIGNVSAGNVSTTGNITAANFIGNTFSLAQTILPTIQSIVISNTSSEYETSGGSGYANVLVANVAPVIEYGVIVTAGSTVDKYVAGNLANIPGTEKITISTGTSDQPFTVYAYVTTNAGTYYSGPEVGFSGLCLLKGTMISLADGTYKPIEDINNDDLLLTWDFDLGRYAQARPLWIKRGETGTRYNELTFSDGTRLRTFDQHRIFNKQAGAFTYPMSDDTPVGTVTVNEHGQEITLVKRDLVWDTIEHYNIITNHHINLFANSVLTSCRFNNIYPITDMKFVKSVVLNRNLSEFAEIESRFVFGLRLQEQSFELAMIEGYVNRLLATEVTESISI